MRRSEKSWANPQKPLDPNRKTERRKETAEFLKRIMKENNLKPKDIMDFLNIPTGTFGGYKNATREIPIKKIRLLEEKFCNQYNSNECEEEIFTTRYKLTEFLKKFNFNSNEQFQCVQYNLLATLDFQGTTQEIQDNILYNTDASVIKKYISTDFLERIKKDFSKVQKEIGATDIFEALSNILPKDVVNSNNIPCFNIDKLNVNNVFESDLEMYIDIPNTLVKDSYNYFGIILNDDFNCTRYHSQDILIIRQGESFAFDYNDELLVFENDRFILKSFEYIDYEEHQHIISVTNFAIDEKHEYSTNDMQDIKVIGTVVAILPRVLQDKREKENGIFNRRLRTLND